MDPKPFYEACVHDSCSCDTGGDCECFCSAVASYAQECTKEGACVFWRTPDLCREWPSSGLVAPPPALPRPRRPRPSRPRPRPSGSCPGPAPCPFRPRPFRPRPSGPAPAPSDPALPPPAIFCDYYNPPDECEWHYEPCGNRSFETCRTLNGIHSNISVSYLEGEPAALWGGPRCRIPSSLGA